MLEFLFNKVAGPKACRTCRFIKNTLAQVFSCEIYELFKNAFFCRTPPVAASEIMNSSSYLRSILPSASTVVEHLLVKMQQAATVLETRTAYFKKEPDVLIDQPRTCRIFMLRYIKSIYF